jgi:two-component system sensor histidine kinase BaeS
MNLRGRFFLLVWPLTVTAMVMLAFVFGRWGVTEINQITVRSTVRTTDSVRTTQVDSVYASAIAGGAETQAARRQLLVRRILVALAIGSLLAAVATLLLSGPLVGRVTELARAVRAVQGGNFAARAPVRGADELAELAIAFNRMTAALSQSEGHRRQLLSDVSHELRTPLTNILGSLEAMEDGIVPFDHAELGRVHDEAMVLVRLVDDLRDVSLDDAGALVLHAEMIDAVDLAVAVAAAFPRVPGRPRIRVTTPPRPVPLRADPGRMAQVLRNLVDNARVHASTESVITLEVTVGPEHIVFAVHNHGPPIPVEHLDRIWERFYRVDRSRSRSTGGMGLGLAVVRRLVEAHNGTVAVQSDASTGTRFEVRIPVSG